MASGKRPLSDGDIPDWVIGSDFNRPDPMTPLFDAYWAVLGMGKHSDRDHNNIADQADEELDDPRRFAGGDGSVYERVDPDDFEED